MHVPTSFTPTLCPDDPCLWLRNQVFQASIKYSSFQKFGTSRCRLANLGQTQTNQTTMAPSLVSNYSPHLPSRSIQDEVELDQPCQSAVSLSILLQAAWIISLRCSLPTDVFCFSYCGSSSHTFYTLRLNQDERVQSFLNRLNTSKPSLNASLSEGHDIQVSIKPPVRCVCLSSVQFIQNYLSRLPAKDTSVSLLTSPNETR